MLLCKADSRKLAWLHCTFNKLQMRGITRPHGRVRIETLKPWITRTDAVASPGLTAGCGLKLAEYMTKHSKGGASPGLTAGCGLKLVEHNRIGEAGLHHPASRPGAD